MRLVSWCERAGRRRSDAGSTSPGAEVDADRRLDLIADDEYLLRAILEPDAEEVVGYQIKMPANGLSDAEAANIVTYIKELSTESSDGS